MKFRSFITIYNIEVSNPNYIYKDDRSKMVNYYLNITFNWYNNRMDHIHISYYIKDYSNKSKIEEMFVYIPQLFYSERKPWKLGFPKRKMDFVIIY